MVKKFILLITLYLLGCSTGSVNNVASTGIPENDDLIRAEAVNRSHSLRDIVYELRLNVDEHSEFFKGTLKAGFNLKDLHQDLRMDFRDGEIKSVTINKLSVSDFKYDGSAIRLPKDKLVSGLNIVEINYQHKFSQDGSGLHRFKDVEDGEVYLFSNFEPFSARKMFPCFDQPDLKATMTLTVVAPKYWQVTSTTMEASKKKYNVHSREWQFATTPKISTYLFSLTAGPFKVWNSQAGKIPLRLLVRKSFAKFVKSNWWLAITQQGLGFYQKYFGYPYPFGKYDQVIIPELPSGAMENVGNVTFNERFVSRSQPTREDQMRASSVILHEMAHMWFGDIVTMKWWNDLWLNESFATYMASLAQYEATEYKEAWRRFQIAEKSWAYYHDQLVTTHPIEAPVESIAQARANFDAITYGKGASVIKQLVYYIGKDNFRKGVQAYIAKYEFANAELSDFISSLQDVTPGKDLKAWAQVWLREPGVDTIQSKLVCVDHKIENVTLELKSVTPSLRPHALQVATFEKKENKLIPEQIVAVEMKAISQEVPEFKGKPCPNVLMPNYNDHDYVLIRLDTHSVGNIKNELSAAEDTLTRLMIWEGLWQMVLDQKLPLPEFVSVFKSQIAFEKDLKIIDRVTGFMVGNDYLDVLYYYPVGNERTELVKYLEDLFWKNILAAKTGSDEFKLWMRKMARVAESQSGLQKLSGVLNNSKLEIDQDLRWEILVRLCRFGFEGTKALLARESKADKSERGIRATMSCEASFPAAKTKAAWMDRLLKNQNPMPMAQKMAVMNSLFPPEQENLFAPFHSVYFGVLKNSSSNRDKYFVEEFAKDLLPAFCSVESSTGLEKFISENKNIDFSVMKALLEGQQEDTRCIKVRKAVISPAVQNQ